MKYFYSTLIVTAMSFSAWAAPGPDTAKILEAGREGNLEQVALAKFKSSTSKEKAEAEGCGDLGPAVFDYRIAKISAESFSQDRGSGILLYAADYFATKACFTGSTQNGAYRHQVESAIVSCAHSITFSSDGKLVVKGRPTCKVKKIDLSKL